MTLAVPGAAAAAAAAGSTSASPARRTALLAIGLAALALVPFLPVLRNGFVNFDDDLYVSDNRHVLTGLTAANVRWAWTTLHAGYWQPLTWMSFQLDAQLFGGRAWGFHLTNVLGHAINVLLFFRLLERLTGATWRSAAAAALFAVHPLRVESVAWVTERKDVLSTFFGLLSLLAYGWYVDRPGLARYAAVAVSLALGLMAKPTLVTWPFVLLLLDYWPLGRLRTDPAPGTVAMPTDRPPATLGWLLCEKIPLLALAAACAAITVYAQHAGGALLGLDRLPVTIRLGNAVLAYGWYLAKTVWPVCLAPLYHHPGLQLSWVQVAAAGAVLLGISAVVASQRRRRYPVVGWLWFLGTLVPAIGLVQAGEQAWADRFTYVPHLGLAILVAWGSHDLVGGRIPRPAQGVILGGVLLALGLLSTFQATRWRESIGLLEYTLRVTDANAVAHNTLGAALLQSGKVAAAEEHFREALAIDAGFPKARFNLGVALERRGQPLQAVACYEEALRLDPNYWPAQYNLGVLLAGRGQAAEAVPHFLEAIRLHPDFPQAHYNLGLAYAEQGEPARAAEQFETAVRDDPEFAAALRYPMGLVLAAHERPADAEGHFRAALRTHPDDSQAHYHLGLALAAQQRWADAVGALSRAAALQPSSPFPASGLAWALEHRGDAAAAEAEYRRAVALDPQWPRTAARRAWALATTAEPRGRNGPWAVALAEQAVHLTMRRDPAALEALAASYAELRRFGDAVAAARQALVVADVERRKQIEERIGLYSQGRPYRTAPGAKM